eukprot:94887_1
MAMFSRHVNPDRVDSSYDNFVSSFLTSIVFFISNENYADVVFPAYEFEPLSWIFFVTGAVFLSLFFTGIVVGSFSAKFTQVAKKNLRVRQLYASVGFTSSYIILDQDRNGYLSYEEFEDFIRNVRPDISREMIHGMFDVMDCRPVDDRIDLKEFVNGLQDISVRRIVEGPPPRSKNIRVLKIMRRFLFENKFIDLIG